MVKWRQAAGLRHIAVHEVISIDWNIVWTTATVDIPRLREQITGLLPRPNESATDTEA